MARARFKNSVKAADSKALALEQVEPLIHEIRGEKVILDSDLARLYGVTANPHISPLKGSVVLSV
jgi:hypothetical protein